MPPRKYSAEVFNFVRKKYGEGLDPITIKERVLAEYDSDVPITTIKDWRPGGVYDRHRRYGEKAKSDRRNRKYEKRLNSPWISYRFHLMETGEGYNNSTFFQREGKKYYYSQLQRLMPVAIHMRGPLTTEEMRHVIQEGTGVSFQKRSIRLRLRTLVGTGVLKYEETTGKYFLNLDSTYTKIACGNEAVKNLFKPSRS